MAKARRQARRLEVLVLDSDRSPGEALARALEAEGCAVLRTRSLERALAAIRERRIPIAWVTLGEGREDPEGLLQGLRAADSDLCVIVLAPEPTVEGALAAMRARAFEYLASPVDAQALRRVLEEAVRLKGLHLGLEERLNAAIGRRVRARRSESRLTLRQLAARTGLSISLISQIELGKSAASISTLYKLARALHVPMAYFFEAV